MERLDKIRLTRKDMLKLSAGGAGMFALTASGFAVPRGIAGGGGGGGGALYIEAFPTSPLIMNPFSDYLNIPDALRPNDLADSHGAGDSATAQPNKYRQDSIGPATDKIYEDRYHQTIGQRQIWPGEGPTAGYFSNNDPIVYQIKVECAHKQFTSSRVTPINSFGKTVVPPKGASGTIGPDGTTTLPNSTIWGFNGTFPGPRINAEYHRPSVVRFENWLGDSDPEGYDSQDFGSPARSFSTHLHHGHTAPESDVRPPPPNRPPRAGVRRPAALRLLPLQLGRARHARRRLEAGRVGRSDVPRLRGRRRRAREAVVLLVPRPRARPHGRERLQGHGRPHAALRPRARQRQRGRSQGTAPPRRPYRQPRRQRSERAARRHVQRGLRHPAGVLRLPSRRRC